MSDLTKEYFDQKLSTLVTKEDLETQLKRQTQELKAYTNEQVESLAAMVAKGFAEMEKRLDLRTEVEGLKLQMREVRRELNLS